MLVVQIFYQTKALSGSFTIRKGGKKMSTEKKLSNFIIVIYFFQSANSCRSSHVTHVHKQILFADIVQNASPEEACREAIGDFWEQETAIHEGSGIRHDRISYRGERLPDNLYVDISILPDHEIRRVWEDISVFMKKFDKIEILLNKIHK
jgi:hypothetical protein